MLTQKLIDATMCLQSQQDEEVSTVSTEEKRIAEKLANACEQLPPGKKEFLLGFAEGVAAMAEKRDENPDDRA